MEVINILVVDCVSRLLVGGLRSVFLQFLIQVPSPFLLPRLVA
jgi:hypothetical protein